MELSQTSLAMLLLAGMPIGAMLHVVYALTDMEVVPDGFVKKMICNVKDFVFLVVAGLAAILTVYFVNHGEFRYLVVGGIIGGFIGSYLMLHKLIVRIRDAILRMIIIPAAWAWTNTLGRLLGKARKLLRIKQTQIRIEQLMQWASNGFEN